MSTDLLERRAAPAVQPEYVEETAESPGAGEAADTADTLAREGKVPPATRKLVRRATVGLALVWTLLWVVPGVEALLTETALGSGAYGQSVETFEVFELLFLGGYYVSRWVPGVAAIAVAGLLVSRRLERRERAAV